MYGYLTADFDMAEEICIKYRKRLFNRDYENIEESEQYIINIFICISILQLILCLNYI